MQITMMRWALGAALAMLAVTPEMIPLRAQSTYGSIVGTARDLSGAVVPQLKVTVTNESTGESHTQLTNAAGAYAFTTLFPGTYRVEADLPGFRAIEIKNIVLQVNQTARYDMNMEVGQVAEHVQVVASAPVLATDTSDVGQVVGNRQIVDLPLNGRTYIQLAGLTNGVILSGATESGGANILSEGGRIHQNSFLVDGVETRIQREGGYGVSLSVDAIEEFKVMQNSFSAEYGRATTIVNSVIKSGGNSLHGSLFEFLRNDKLDARNAFDLSGKKPPLRQNQFGGSVGGPIRRDRLFYFLNYESQIVRRGATRFDNVPTPAMLAGDLTGTPIAADPSTGAPFPGNRIPESRVVTFAKAARPYYPLPNSTTLPNLNYEAVLSNPTNMYQGTARIDYNIRSQDRLSGHYTAFDYARVNLGTLPFSGTQSFSKTKNVAVEETHSFTPRMLNDFRFGYNYSDTYTGPERLLDRDVNPDWGLKNLSPEPRAYAPPQVRLQGFGSVGGGAFIPNGAIDRNYQFVDQFVYTAGRHSIKTGADLRFYRYNDLGYATQNGYYTFTNRMYTKNALADFLLGLPQEAFANQRGGKNFSFDTYNGEYSFYIQDDIKVNRSLTINAGLRYEYVQWPLEKHDEFANWNFQKGRPDFAGRDIPRRTAAPDRKDWAPRLGLAYSPSFLKKTVIRAGAGIAYGNFRQWEVSLMHFNPPFVYDNFYFNDLPTPRFTTDSLWPAVPKTLDGFDFTQISVNYQEPHKVLPRMYQWNFGIQREIMPNVLFEAGYVGNRGERQPHRYDGNAARFDVDPAHPTPIQSRRPYSTAAFVSANGFRAWSNYNALNLRLERRYSSGFSVLGVYTWSKALAISSNSPCCVSVLDDTNIRLNYGPVNDFAHNAVISYVYDLPFGPGKAFLRSLHGVPGLIAGGWQVNGITTFRSGGALRVTSPVSNNLGNRAGNRPDRIGNGNLPSDQRNVERWFDTSAFRDPVFGRYGNTGEGVIRGPGLVNWDLSLFKNTRIAESMNLQFRFEMFNAFNHVNLNNPSLDTGDPRFGRITGASTGREIQLGLKLIF